MSGVPVRVAGLAAWVAVVAAGAVVVWLVISRAGSGLLADAVPVTTPATPSVAGEGSPTAAPGTARRGSWQGESGVVTATCQGGRIALVGAQPEDGVVVRVEDRGPEKLVVAFDGDDDGSVTVVATCHEGAPTFTSTSGSPSDTSPAGPTSGATSEGGDDRTVPGDD